MYLQKKIFFLSHLYNSSSIKTFKMKNKMQELYSIARYFSQGEGLYLNFILQGHSRPRTSCKDYKTGRKFKNRNKLIIFYAVAHVVWPAYVLHDIRQVAALADLSRNKTRIQRQEILDIRQVAALNFATFCWLGCICTYVRMLLYVCGLCLCICAWKGHVWGVWWWKWKYEWPVWKFFLFIAIY